MFYLQLTKGDVTMDIFIKCSVESLLSSWADWLY